MRRSEGWGTELRKRIRESIQAKTFIAMLALLAGCCIIIYGMVLIFLPKSYRTEMEGQVTEDFYELTETLEAEGWEESSDRILEFSMKNNASVRIDDESGENVFGVNFADDEAGETPAKSLSCSASFAENGQTYRIFAEVSLVPVSQSYGILLNLIPLIAAIILLISVMGALSVPVISPGADPYMQRRQADDRAGHDMEM